MKLFPILVLVAGFLGATVVGSTSAEEPSDIRPARDDMVRVQIETRGIKDPRVLAAMREVPRHLFVPQALRSKAYTDRPLPIGDGQTISQPYIVALMTEVLSLNASSRVLEIGTGSGYQAAVLAAVAGDVYTIEIKAMLYTQADRNLRTLRLDKVKNRLGDGYYGWAEQAPFDAIMITAAVDHIPPPLLRQLKDGGRLVLPLGNPFSYQNLVLVTKHAEDYTVKQITGVLFVPLTGYALDRKR
ncbi:MAG: protein-L-isoaspartate(D-aspartate) O-methyltransferase [Desulfobacterales bacterium]|nr:protein-L-isoaspartate(D-aspartate) O-methyltransferase [Desulfobacterales bacterium]